MNILLVNDDGPKAVGLTLLEEAVRGKYPEATIVVLTSDRPFLGQAMSTAPVRTVDELAFEKVGTDRYVLVGKPADLIYLAMLRTDLLLPSKRMFDLVLAGVNHGRNVGFDIFHSGTVGMCFIASNLFGIPSVAFSQSTSSLWATGHDEELKEFSRASHLVRNFLDTTRLGAGDCWNVNFPVGTPKGWRYCPADLQSSFRHRMAKSNERLDISVLESGYVTTTELRLRANVKAWF